MDSPYLQSHSSQCPWHCGVGGAVAYLNTVTCCFIFFAFFKNGLGQLIWAAASKKGHREAKKLVSKIRFLWCPKALTPLRQVGNTSSAASRGAAAPCSSNLSILGALCFEIKKLPNNICYWRSFDSIVNFYMHQKHSIFIQFGCEYSFDDFFSFPVTKQFC